MLRALAVAATLVAGAGLAAQPALAQSPPTPPAKCDGNMEHCQKGQMTMPRDHMGHMQHGAPGAASGTTALSGQDAFAAMGEVVRMLDADPSTDWSKVDLERLRQHLIDMNEVVLRSQVKQEPVPGGVAAEVTGAGRTEQAIVAMLVPHAAELNALPDLAAKAEPIPGGVRLTVTSRQDSPGAVARLRGLGFAGLLTLGAHHAPHHLAMARGEAMPAGHSHAPAPAAPAPAPAPAHKR